MSGGLLALTFDDGPDAEITGQILDILVQYKVPASFFLIGQNITPETVPVMQRAVALGCELCHHSFTHPYMTAMPPEAIAEEMRRTTERIQDTTGQTPRFFRPPYFAVNQRMFSCIDLPFIAGYGVQDYNPEITEDERYSGIMARAKDDRILLLHDFAGNDKTVGAVRRLVPDLLAEGFTFVTVSQLFAKKGVVPRSTDRILYSYTAQTVMYAPDA